MVTHLNIAAFCYTYTRAGDGEVSGLLLIGSPSNERRKSHGSIDRDVARLCGVVVDIFLVSTAVRAACMMA